MSRPTQDPTGKRWFDDTVPGPPGGPCCRPRRVRVRSLVSRKGDLSDLGRKGSEGPTKTLTCGPGNEVGGGRGG